VNDELRELLETVSQRGLRALTVDELLRLRALVEEKDYSGDKKAEKSKKKLLGKINVELYNKHSPRRFF
jgi:hypothetical protein